jgi:hypothetical protein
MLHGISEETAVSTSTDLPTYSIFILELSRDAALHNVIVLENYNFDLSKAVLDQQDSQVFFGSEFQKNSKNYYYITPTGNILKIYFYTELHSL